MAWSPDGKQVLTGSGDSTARLWEAASGRTIATLEGHSSWVHVAAWSPDGKQVLTSGDDTTARIWIVDNNVIAAELTHRLCNIFPDDAIRVEIPS